MMRKTFGQFESPQEANPTGSQAKASTPPIMGAPMPNAGMKNQNMGNVSPPKDKPSPKQFAQRQAAGKRLNKMPNQSPLGPITGGPAKPQARPQARPQTQQQQQEPVGTGDRWMGELWQGLTLDEQPQGGFTMGGKVGNTLSPEMDLYSKVTMELESGGVGGYAHGGMVEQSREIASKGRNGDTMLMHIQPQELEGLQSLLGPVTINPNTGNPEAFAWIPFLATAALMTGGGAGIGALMGGKEGAKKGALMGLGLGLTGGAAAGFAGAGAGAGGTGLLAGAKGAGGATATGIGAAPTVATAAPTVTAGKLGTLTMPSVTKGLSAKVAGTKAAATGGTGKLGAITTPDFAANFSQSLMSKPSGIEAAFKSAMPSTDVLQGAMNKIATNKKIGEVAKGVSRAASSGLASLQDQSGNQQQMAPPPPSPAPRRLKMAESPYEKMKRRRLARSGSLPGSGSVV